MSDRRTMHLGHVGGPVWRQDTLRNAMPVARRHRERALPNAWRCTRIWWPQGSRNGNYRHGRYTAQAMASRTWVRQFTRDVRAMTKRMRHSV